MLLEIPDTQVPGSIGIWDLGSGIWDPPAINNKKKSILPRNFLQIESSTVTSLLQFSIQSTLEDLINPSRCGIQLDAGWRLYQCKLLDAVNKLSKLDNTHYKLSSAAIFDNWKVLLDHLLHRSPSNVS